MVRIPDMVLTDSQRRLLTLLDERERVSHDELETTVFGSYEESRSCWEPLREQGLVVACVPASWDRGWLEITPHGRELLGAP
jgi:hypothetical protein